MEGKMCTKCKCVKPLSEFNKNRKSKDGFQYQCKRCNYTLKEKLVLPFNTKECSKCKLLLDFSNFFKAKNGLYGYNSFCKDCNRILRGQIKKVNEVLPEGYKRCASCKEIKEIGYFGVCVRELDKLRHSCKTCVWNREKNSYIRIWRKSLSSLLVRLGKIKEGHTTDLLGYSALELKNHLESLFTEGMTWDNYGEWHIDHIIPLSTFNRNTQPNIVNALSNLRPLWATTREINNKIYEGNLNRKKKNK